jgi:exopolysaccharide biosynthesis polyprenyl glycosylphosphotransferase
MSDGAAVRVNPDPAATVSVTSQQPKDKSLAFDNDHSLVALLPLDFAVILAITVSCDQWSHRVDAAVTAARLVPLLLGPLLLIALLAERGVYAARARPAVERLRGLAMGSLQAAGMVALALLMPDIAFRFMGGGGAPVSGTLAEASQVIAIGLAFPVIAAAHLMAWRTGTSSRSHRAIVVGTNAVGRQVIEHLRSSAANVRIVGVVSELGYSGGPSFCGLPVVGSADDLLGPIRVVHADLVVMALSSPPPPTVRAAIEGLAFTSVDVALVPDLTGFDLGAGKLMSLNGMPLLYTTKRALTGLRAALKRTEDVVLGSLMLACAAPLMVVVAALVKFDSPGPVLFRQPRVGLGGKVFHLLKFRTMHVHLSDLGASRQTSRGDPRVTRVGRVLRRISLDELPQILNVLAGSMSLVGPRPHALNTTVGSVPLATAVPSYPLRYRVKPGITGLAQISGTRGELNSVEKLRWRVKFDLEYIDKWSFPLDVSIMLRTLRLVVADPNAY